jgi:hypothetical protein
MLCTAKRILRTCGEKCLTTLYGSSPTGHPSDQLSKVPRYIEGKYGVKEHFLSCYIVLEVLIWSNL